MLVYLDFESTKNCGPDARDFGLKARTLGTLEVQVVLSGLVCRARILTRGPSKAFMLLFDLGRLNKTLKRKPKGSKCRILEVSGSIVHCN